MPTIVVEVMPKAELLDPQGKAVAGALSRTGHGRFDVRVGKRFEITTESPADAATLADIEKIAHDILSNSVIEDVVGIHVVPVAEPAGAPGAAAGPSASSGTASSGAAN